MKKIKIAKDKIEKKNIQLKRQLEKKSGNLKFKTNDPNRLNIYW